MHPSAARYDGSTMNPVTDMPGIYPGIALDDYFRIPAINSSLVRAAVNHRGEISMEAMKWAMDHPPQRTRAMRFGSLFHCGQLEPAQIMRRYAVMPAYHTDHNNVTAKGKPTESKSTRHYKDQKAEFERANAGREIVEQSEYDQMNFMLRSLATRPQVRQWIGSGGGAEVTRIWRHPDSGLLLKVRIDKEVPGDGIIIDFKTTSDMDSFDHSIYRYGYHIQAVMQADAYAATDANGTLPVPGIVAVESQPPYRCRCHWIDGDRAETARRIYGDVLKLAAVAMKSGAWLDRFDCGVWGEDEEAGVAGIEEYVDF
jgi:hypothetical protein